MGKQKLRNLVEMLEDPEGSSDEENLLSDETKKKIREEMEKAELKQRNEYKLNRMQRLLLRWRSRRKT